MARNTIQKVWDLIYSTLIFLALKVLVYNCAQSWNNGFVVGSAGDQWISPRGKDRLNGLIEDGTDWYGFIQVVPILFILSTCIVFGLAFTDSKAESRGQPLVCNGYLFEAAGDGVSFMNGNLTFVLLLSLFKEGGWDIESLDNYSWTCLLFSAVALGIVFWLNWKLTGYQSAHDADPRNAEIPFSPTLGTWKRAIGIYAENIMWIVSLSWCYLFFLQAYDKGNVVNTQTMEEFSNKSSNTLVIVYTVCTVLITISHTAVDTMRKKKKGAFKRNKAAMEMTPNPLQEEATPPEAPTFEVTMGTYGDEQLEKADTAAPSHEQVEPDPSTLDWKHLTYWERWALRWSLVVSNTKFMVKTIHGIMLVQWLKDNKQVFRQALGGVVGEVATPPGKEACDGECDTSNWTGIECCRDAMDEYFSRQNNATTLGDLYEFWLVIFAVTLTVLMIPKLMKWYTDSAFEDSNKCTHDKSQYPKRFFIGQLSVRFNDNWKSSFGFAFAKVTQSLLTQYIKPGNGSDPAMRWFMLGAMLTLCIGALSDVFRNMDDWQKQNIKEEDFVDDDDVDDYFLDPRDPIALRRELDEMKAWKAEVEQLLSAPHGDTTGERMKQDKAQQDLDAALDI